MSVERITNYINGELLPPVCNETLDIVNPATNEIIAQCPNSSIHDLELAINAAKTAQPLWESKSVKERAQYLLAIATKIKENLSLLAELECRDTGKPLMATRSIDIPRAAENFEFFASFAVSWHEQAYQMGTSAINYTQNSPLGIVGCISPWNLPLYLLTWKIAPALITGNCVIAKPSEITPLTAHYLAKICIEVGLPAGVLTILHGEGQIIGDLIVNHPDIKAISFTGGTNTGQVIAQNAAKQLKKTSLELGGKNPALIYADCDFNKMMDTTLRSSFSNQGQICLCTSRLYIEKPIYEQFKKYFLSQAEGLIVGDPMERTTTQGSVVSEQHYNKILNSIETAKSEGASVLIGGEPAVVSGRCSNGFFIQPTVLENLTTETITNKQEIFGPVVSLIPFEDHEAAIEQANQSDYGLASVVWTQDINRAHKVSHRLQSGIVWVNQWMLRDLRTPFGGMKLSGMGREGGMHALNFFTETKNICIGLT